MHCYMRGCYSRYSPVLCERRFFAFPKDLERAREWVKACGLTESMLQWGCTSYAKARVCDLHFKECHMNRRYLKATAVPVPFQIQPAEGQPIQTKDVGVINSDSDNDEKFKAASSSKGPKRGQIKKKAEKKPKQLTDVLSELQKDPFIINLELVGLINLLMDIRLLERANSNEIKSDFYALILYLSGPKTYKTLRATLELPSEKELRKKDVCVEDAINSIAIIECLEAKLNYLHEKDRHCTVCLKKVPLTRFLYYRIAKDNVIGFQNVHKTDVLAPATHAYVLIARGLRAKWEQPLAYCFMSENQPTHYINPWLDAVLSILLRTGYEVAAVVVDPEDLYNHFRARILSLVEPYLLVNERKIYCIFDLPQLIISLRDTLKAHRLQFRGEDGSKLVADWEKIRELYKEYQVEDKCLLVPKLTKSHLDPNDTEKKELKYAAQVFSRSVSQALELDMKKRKLDCSKMKGTQKLIELVNDVFDILNSSVLNHHNKSKKAFTGEPYQMKTIRKFMEFLTDVQLVDCSVEDGSFDCIYGLRITIMSFIIILRDLLPKGITALVTHRFNLDAAERFCHAVRKQSRRKKPTPLQFFKSFRKMFMVELLKCPKNSNAPDDLSNFGKALKLKSLKDVIWIGNDFKKTIEVCTVDYRFEVPASDGFSYICWYLLKTCYETHKCDKLLQDENYHKLKDNDTEWKQFFKCDDLFMAFIRGLHNQLNESFGNKMEVGLATGILMVMINNNFQHICRCFPVHFVRRLFVRMRIFQIIRYNNRNFRNESFQFTINDELNLSAGFNTTPTVEMPVVINSFSLSNTSNKVKQEQE